MHIETATTVCSVAISNTADVLFHKELDAGFTHAENLHLFMEEGLKALRLEPQQLAAIGVSKGPGSYTGLRIGVSSAKGLAYALKVPLISVDTLQIIAAAARLQGPADAVYCPMIDARRMEVYTAVYDENLTPLTKTESLIVEEASISRFETYKKVFFVGDGMPKCKALLSSLKNADFIEGIYPAARHMAPLVYERFRNQHFEDPAYFEPFYLKDFLAGKKKKQV